VGIAEWVSGSEVKVQGRSKAICTFPAVEIPMNLRPSVRCASNIVMCYNINKLTKALIDSVAAACNELMLMIFRPPLALTYETPDT